MKKGKPIERSEVFLTLFRDAETRDEYHIAGVKIEIVDQIYLLMERQHITQADLAGMLGTSSAYISRILKGKTNFTIETLVKIGRRLNAEWSFTLVEKKQDKQNTKSEVI